MNSFPQPRISLQSKEKAIPLFRQTRSRILLLYMALMLACMGAAVPIFQYLVEQQVSERVREDLDESRANFETSYHAWEQTPNQSVSDLKAFIDQFLDNYRPEDDNFLILVIDGQFYRANPSVLPKPIQTDSELFQQWQQFTRFEKGDRSTSDPDIGTILYQAMPLILDGDQRGMFIAVHATAGEQNEALASIYTFSFVILGVLLCSFFLAWLGTGKLLKPVRELAATARSISESDLTQRISVEGRGELADLSQTFNAMMDRLQGAFDSQRRFVNDAGHELRTPVTIIRGHLELMGDDPQEQQETVDLVIDELDRMGRLINEMIALAKAERPDFLQYETIDLPSFTEAVFAKAQSLADRQWLLDLPEDGTFRGDRQRLTGALLNLLRNAAQHTDHNGTIEFGSLRSSAQVKFWVTDTGRGIPPSEQVHIFERFARGSNPQGEGTGLGLAIVKAFVEAHQGQITLVSEPNKGSTFTITLPRVEDHTRFSKA